MTAGEFWRLLGRDVVLMLVFLLVFAGALAEVFAFVTWASPYVSP